MSADIMVSVICLAYNHEKYIRKALEGFVSQKTDFGYEVFVHDDASTDETQKIIAEYAEKYPQIIKPVFQTENQYSKGVPFLKTAVLPLAMGKYFAMCEGDDYWTDPYKLQKQYDLMEANPQVGMCTHKVQCVSEDDAQMLNTIPQNWQLDTNVKLFSDSELVGMLFEHGMYPFHTSSYFMRRDVYTWEHRYQVAKFVNGDVSYMYSAVLHGGICYIDEIMSNRRMMTIGNYNARLKKAPLEKKIERDLKVIDGYMLFNQLSGGKYNKRIVNAAYFRMMYLELVKYAGQETVKAYCKKFKKMYKFVWSRSMKSNGKYILYLLAPGVLKRIFTK